MKKRKKDVRTARQMSRGLFSFSGLFGQICVAWWVPALQWRLGQAILEQAGAKGEKAKGPSTTQTPVPPQWATLGPCGLASGAGRQLAGALSPHLLLVLSISFFWSTSLSLSPISLHVWPFLSLYPVNLFPLSPLKHPHCQCCQVSPVLRQTELRRRMVEVEKVGRNLWGWTVEGGGHSDRWTCSGDSHPPHTHIGTLTHTHTYLQHSIPPPSPQGRETRAGQTRQGNRYLRWRGECG